MKKTNKKFLFVASSLCALSFGAGLVACNDEPTHEPPLQVKLCEDFGNQTCSVSILDGVWQNVTVPSIFDGKQVVAIAQNESETNTTVTTVHLPDTVQTIESKAFFGYENLEKLTFGGNPFSALTFNGEYLTSNGMTVKEDAFENTSLPIISANATGEGTLVKFELENWIYGNKIQLSTSLNEHTDQIFQSEKEITTNEDNTAEVTVDFGTYGLFHNINLTIIDGEESSSVKAGGVAVTASEYNFAHLNASFPVLLYSLDIKNVTKNGQIPTFTTLERYDSYDWDYLPENVRTIPTLTREESIQLGFHPLRSHIASYIKHLYELNPQSKFNFYFVDNYCELILEFAYANNIPESNFSVTLLSDGNGTVYYLNDTLAVQNSDEKVAQMRENWQNLKETVKENGYNESSLYEDVLYPENGQNSFSMLARYAYIIASEENNVTWITSRIRPADSISAINDVNPTLAEAIASVKQEANTNGMLSALAEEDAEAFKSLYKFNDDMFETAKVQNKKAMMILGTKNDFHNRNFYTYMKLTMDTYGTEEYVYYYKGHPGQPTSVAPERQNQMDDLAQIGYEIEELDASIAAEIILYFNPDIYCCGWGSTTFKSITNEKMACSLFAVTKEGAYNANNDMNEYCKLIDSFISVVEKGATELKGVALDGEKNYYLIEYNDYTDLQKQTYAKHEFAIYCVETGETHYYQQGENSPIAVDQNGNPIE